MPDNLGYSIFLDPADTVRAWQARGRLQPTVHWSEMQHEDHASAFTIAKIAKLDLLRQMQASLDDVIRNGGTLEGWQAKVLPELQRQGWWGAVTNAELTGTPATVIVNERRLRTIYDTNVRMSLASGAWARIQRQKDVLPYLRYLPSSSEHKRPLHKLWYGVLLPVDHPWWATHFPPNGWMCKCHYEQVSERRMKQKGWAVTPESEIPGFDQFTDWQPATGSLIKVPAGIDPGFGYNPGIAHLRVAADKASTSIQLALDAGLEPAARQTVRELVDDVAFDQFLAKPAGNFPVAILSEHQRSTFAASSQMVVLPTGVMNKQLGLASGFSGHPELTIADYRLLPGIVEHALVIAQQGINRLIFFADAQGNIWKAVVRQDQGEVYPIIVSFHRSRARNIAPETRNLTILLDRR